MEMAGEPRLDAAVLAYKLYELDGGLAARVVEPTTAIDDVVLLQNAQAAADRRCVREHKHFPPVLRRVLLAGLLKPL